MADINDELQLYGCMGGQFTTLLGYLVTKIAPGQTWPPMLPTIL
jgi:hypothetical protein